MAENSKGPSNISNGKKGELKDHAKLSSPSFDPRKNQPKQKNGVNGNPKAMIKKKLLKEGIKKGAQAYGVPEVATEKILNTSVGQEALDAAATSPTITGGVNEATKVIVKRTVLPVVLISSIAPFVLILLFFLIIFGKDSFGGIGDDTDIYEDLRKEIGSTISNYKSKVDIDGALILATLIGYSDNEEIEDSAQVSKNIANMKRQVSKLASYQVMVTKNCTDDSSTIRKIASNDSLLSEDNRNCVTNTDGENYSLSIGEGDFADDNSGSVYFWNLIDENFIFDYYNEYMINKLSNTSENDEKINEIISEIYSYYESLLLESAGEDFFASYITNTGYWWPIGTVDAEVGANGKLFAGGLPREETVITSNYGIRPPVYHNGVIISGGPKNPHMGIDIANFNYRGNGVTNIIASKSGEVVEICSSSINGSYCGDGYGEYVVLMHSDEVYTMYAHMHPNTITVTKGEFVEQGQVVGKMGTSGNSSGTHLHFEIREGGNSKTNAVDPLLYVDPEDPRPSGDDDFFKWVSNIECANCETDPARVDGDNYIVYRTNTGSLDVAYGIQLVDQNGNSVNRFPEIYDGPVEEGTRIPKATVKKIFNRIQAGSSKALLTAKAKYGATFSRNQEVAVLSLAYNAGNGMVDPAVSAYVNGGDAGYWNYTKEIYHSDNTANDCGLKIRRAEEYEMFTKADFKYDPLSWNCSRIKYYDTNSW